MKLAERYNRYNFLASLIVLILTGFIYYGVIHFILTDKLDKDLVVEESEIKTYVDVYKKLPLPANYHDQQVSYRQVTGMLSANRQFKYTTYYNSKEKETEPARSLITIIYLNKIPYEVKITKSRVEAEDLVRIILYITFGVTLLLLICLTLINRFLLNRLWGPFYTLLAQMKTFEVARMDGMTPEKTNIDEFNELYTSANVMAMRVEKDYTELKSFTDNASHEMMTPLAVINSKLDSLLQTESFTSQQAALLEDIYLAVGRLSRLNQSLLLLAKIDNNLIPDIQEIDLQDLVLQKLRQFQELIAKDHLSLSQQINPARISMSKYLADILLNNLLSNAIRHNLPEGSLKVLLRPNSLEVINTGKDGMINQHRFNRFSKSQVSEGMGLGLAIVKQICALYHFNLEYLFKDDQHHFIVHF